jgi:hypothetical protein
MANRGKVGLADPRDRPTWPHHISRCAFSQWLICGPLWRFQVYGSVGGGLLGLWALESLCWTCSSVWFVRRCFSWVDEVSWTRGICVPAHRHWFGVGPTRAHDIMWSYLCISLPSGLRSMQMIYPFRPSRRTHHNGVVQIGIWYCLWWCHIHAINALASSCIISCVFGLSCVKS